MSSASLAQQNEGQGTAEGKEFASASVTMAASSSASGTATPTGVTPTQSPPAGPNDALLSRLRSQVEFYFGQQNLSRDIYLRNLLAQYGGTSVPLIVICNFPKVRDLCLGFNLHADPPLVMRALEGSQVAFVTPDANWISAMLPLPPLALEPKVKVRPPSLGPGSRSVSSSHEDMTKMNGSAPGSPLKSVPGQGQATQPQVNANVSNGMNVHPMQQTQGQPSMVRSRSITNQASHYHPANGPVPLPQGMPVPTGPGYSSPYNYPYPHRNMPPPGNYAQPAGYMYPPPMQQHPHPSGAAPMQYPQMYPGYTYVTTSQGPSNYFQRPGGMVRNTSSATARSAPSGPTYENGQQRRQGQGQGQGHGGINSSGAVSMRNVGAGNIRQEGQKGRKNRTRPQNQNHNDSGTNYQHMIGGRGMSRKESREQMHQPKNYSDNDAGQRNDINMPNSRSQNEMSDSSGGGGKSGRRKKNKNKRDNERRNDVNFDDNQFPALSPTSPTKVKDGSADKASIAMSGYAAALLQKSKTAALQSMGANIHNGEFPDVGETDIIGKVSEMKLNSEIVKDSDPDTISSGAGAVIGAPIFESTEAVVGERNPSEGKHEATEVSKSVPATSAAIEEKTAVEFDGPTPKEAKHSGSDNLKVENAVKSVEAKAPPSTKDNTTAPAAPSAWGNKRSFIDVVKKQP